MAEMIWHQAVTSRQLQEGLNALLATLSQKQTVLLVVDTRRLRGFRAGDEAWLKSCFMPKVNQVRVQRFARITNPDIFTEAISSNIHIDTQSQVNLSTARFFDREKALEWLLESVTGLRQQKPCRGDYRANCLI